MEDELQQIAFRVSDVERAGAIAVTADADGHNAGTHAGDLGKNLRPLDFGRAGGRIWLVGRTASDGAGLARVEVVARDHWGLESRRTLDLRFEARAVEE